MRTIDPDAEASRVDGVRIAKPRNYSGPIVRTTLPVERAGAAERCCLRGTARPRRPRPAGRCGRRSALSVPGGDPAVDVLGAAPLLVGGGVEHGEAEQRAIAGVERAERQGRLGVAAGHQDHPAALAEQGDGHLQVRARAGSRTRRRSPRGRTRGAAPGRRRSCSSGPGRRRGRGRARPVSGCRRWSRRGPRRPWPSGRPSSRRRRCRRGRRPSRPAFSWPQRNRPRWAVMPTSASAAASGVGDALGGRIEPVLADGGVLGRGALAAEQALVRAPDPIARP